MASTHSLKLQIRQLRTDLDQGGTDVSDAVRTLADILYATLKHVDDLESEIETLRGTIRRGS